ncbi:MAG TPA: diiron oxygenase [Candidatus Dormibacteraeota bacterium]|nr:diiron oxygenase [Candidatus Dormibacteraeota bacterium]
MTAVASLTGELPQEEQARADADEAYQRLLARLSHQSVVKHFDAYADVPWDDPAFAIDPDDPRFELSDQDALGTTAWYQAQPQPVRARIGLHMIATFARIGWQFESVLKRGLLEFALRLPEDAPEFRYCYHEVIEEAQHSLIFHEFVQRTGLPTRPPRILGVGDRLVVGFARRFPELFFLFVLAGEDPIDYAQREMLQSGRELHPLIERISRIHVTEEARHIAFARHYLRRNVPRLRGPKLFILRLRTMIVMAVASRMMSRPSGHVVRTYGIPADVLREAYGPGSKGAEYIKRALFKPRELCWELGVLNQRWAGLWKRLGIYAPQGSPI